MKGNSISGVDWPQKSLNIVAGNDPYNVTKSESRTEGVRKDDGIQAANREAELGPIAQR